MLAFQINPSLEIKREGNKFLLCFQIDSRKVILEASPWDLIVLKILSEGLDPLELARKEKISLSILQKAFLSAANKGIILRKESKLVRKEGPYQNARFPDESFKIAEVFTLQWHLTHRCDLHCKHCYDRTMVAELSLKENLNILEQFFRFCNELQVFGQISFSGGNPFLYPGFFELYKAASEMGFSLAILGNPISENLLERLCKIEVPVYFQVSLEGLEGTNDDIRGKGHFKKTLHFLRLLKDYGVTSGVMMTLHEKNLKDLIPLALYLDGKVDIFNFNRLSLVGEGRNLSPADKESFYQILEEYLNLSEKYPHLHLKDNFFNYLLYQKGKALCGGCTGFGCGAAFNFLTLLPHGEVHACRKFPSSLGNILEQTFEELYFSDKAELYRLGPADCQDCLLYGLCRGCLAVISSSGLNPFKDSDPYCPGKIITP